MLDCFSWFCSVLQCPLCLFSLFQDFFAGAASLMLQQQLSEFLTFFTYAA
jgi:hypothetical protein